MVSSALFVSLTRITRLPLHVNFVTLLVSFVSLSLTFVGVTRISPFLPWMSRLSCGALYRILLVLHLTQHLNMQSIFDVLHTSEDRTSSVFGDVYVPSLYEVS